MGEKMSEKNWALVFNAKFNMSMMERLDKSSKDIQECAKRGLELQDESSRTLSEIVSIMKTAGNKLSNTYLIYCCIKLNDAINPSYPFDFPSLKKISHYWKMTKDAFFIATGLHSQGWEKIYQDNAIKMQSSRPEDFNISNEKHKRVKLD